MIKFIATDLDGTLLNDDKQMPDGIFPLIEELHELGVLFAPASGRQYANLKKLFAPVADKIIFICENGALVSYKGETLYCNPIEDEKLPAALNEIRAIPHLYPVLCGSKCAYIENDAHPFCDYAMHAYTNCKKVNSLNELIGFEPICKIAIYDEIAAAENCIKLLPQRLPSLRTILSGYDWCDVSSPTANKGEAIRYIRKALSLRKDECAAFGDHMNDYEMLLECGRAYVTENAYPPLKKLICRTVPSNADGGVLLMLKEMIKQIKGESS